MSPSYIVLVTFVNVLCVNVMHLNLRSNLQCIRQAKINGRTAMGSLLVLTPCLVAQPLTQPLQSTLGVPIAPLMAPLTHGPFVHDVWACAWAAVPVDVNEPTLLKMTHLALPPQSSRERLFGCTCMTLFLGVMPRTPPALLLPHIRMCNLLGVLGYSLRHLTLNSSLYVGHRL